MKPPPSRIPEGMRNSLNQQNATQEYTNSTISLPGINVRGRQNQQLRSNDAAKMWNPYTNAFEGSRGRGNSSLDKNASLIQELNRASSLRPDVPT